MFKLFKKKKRLKEIQATWLEDHESWEGGEGSWESRKTNSSSFRISSAVSQGQCLGPYPSPWDTSHQLPGPVFCNRVSLGWSCGHVLDSLSGQTVGFLGLTLPCGHLIFEEAWKGEKTEWNQNYCYAGKLWVGSQGGGCWSQDTQKRTPTQELW